MRRATIVLAVTLPAAVLSHCAPGRGQSDDAPDQLARVLADTAPEDRPAEREALARRQAAVALALLRSGRADATWSLLEHRPDPSLRTHLVLALGASGADPDMLARQLNVEQDPSIRRALVWSLGGFTDDRLPRPLRGPLVTKLVGWYRDDPDPGIHAAVDWLLRHGRQGERARVLDWGQRDRLVAIDRELAGRPLDGRSWYVTREGQTMVAVRGPVEFRMGSPAHEVGRMPASDSPKEPYHTVRVPRSFAISNKEITVAEFRRFLDANRDVKRRHGYADNPTRMAEVLAQFSPDDDGPQIAVTWYEAAMYCNWLSQQEGLPQSQWVYSLNPDDIRSGMRMPADHLHRTGYRLPTEAEWEYAARAGATTSRFYGTSDSLLSAFAWYSKHPPKKKGDPVDPSDPQRTWPVGQLMPNDLGLFDVLGNVWEWTQDRVERLGPSQTIREDSEDSVLVITDSVARTRRGGGFPYEAAMMRSAARGTVNALPTNRRDNVGFRIARTLPLP